MHAAPHRKMWFDAKTFRCWFKNGPATLTNVECCRFRPHHTLMSGHETVTGVKRESRGDNGRTLSQTQGKREEKIRWPRPDLKIISATGFARKVSCRTSSLCNLCVLCVSVVSLLRIQLTTETQRTQRLHREERSADFSCKAPSTESFRHLFDLRPRSRIDFADCLQKLRVLHSRTEVGPTLRLSLNHTELLLFRVTEIASGGAL